MVAGHRRVESMPFTLALAVADRLARKTLPQQTGTAASQQRGGSDRGVEPSAGQPVVSGTARTAWAGRAARMGEGAVTTKAVRS
jgi:hypothetical protein